MSETIEVGGRREAARTWRGRAQAAICLAAAALLLSACVSGQRPAFTAAEEAAASPPGFHDVRQNDDDPRLVAWLRRGLVARTTNPQGEIKILSLSGGGANGAFGAGVLYGWTQSGARPDFDIVTGVSTGALIAPFAFLGPDWDPSLRRAYLDGRTNHLLVFEGLKALFRPSLYSGRPLDDLVASFVDDRLLAAIAEQSRRGRRLIVATSNLDTQNLVIWDLGAIAAHGGPQARTLFRKVLVASASVPGIFPPVMIEVEANGRRFSEMHVDGSTINAFFAVPESMLDGGPAAPRPQRPSRLYVLLNGELDREFLVTPRALVPLVVRAFDTQSKANIRTSLAAVSAFGRTAGMTVEVGSIPPGPDASPLNFRYSHMAGLFELGRARAAAGQVWHVGPADAPPPADAGSTTKQP